MNSMWDTWNANRVETYNAVDGTITRIPIWETQDYETMALYFYIMFYGLLNFKAPAVESGVA